jgi:large subunit ribosomal protein L24
MTAVKYKIKKGDKVVVTTGRDKGKTGEVLRVLTEQSKLLVQGVNIQTKHRKPSSTSPGGIEKIESPIHVSNVAIVDPKEGKATRVGYKALKDGRKVRFAKKSNEVID